MSLSEKYYPKLQKDLINQNVVTDIKKWITNNLINNKENDYKKILYILGPIGCGKTTTINYLFTNYNIINLEPDQIKTNEKVLDILRSMVGFKTKTLIDIDKWNNKNYKEKYNIILIDNIELCDKYLNNFINLLYNEYSINIPIIVIGTNSKGKDAVKDFKNINFINFPMPKLNDINKIIDRLTEREFEQIKISNNLRTILVNKSENDLRQFFFILEQLKLSLHNVEDNIDIETLINNIDSKIVDIDLFDKIRKIITDDINCETRYIISSSEPQTISYSIYQNYLDIIQNYNHTQNYEDKITTSFNVIDNLSISNTIHSNIYDDQNWELYDEYTYCGCVIPSKILNNNCKFNELKNMPLNNFKDISYNFLNSLSEVINIIKNNNFQNHLQNNKIPNDLLQKDISGTYIVIGTMSHVIKKINKYFDEKKRGKNSTKQEKFEIFDMIENTEIKDGKENDMTNIKALLSYICKFIYFYNIFEVDMNDILLNKNMYRFKEQRQKYVNKIDIRIFKRLLNIFMFNDGNKIMKSHTEIVIQYKIFTILINDLDENPAQKQINHIDNLITDITNIWNI